MRRIYFYDTKPYDEKYFDLLKDKYQYENIRIKKHRFTSFSCYSIPLQPICRIKERKKTGDPKITDP